MSLERWSVIAFGLRPNQPHKMQMGTKRAKCRADLRILIP